MNSDFRLHSSVASQTANCQLTWSLALKKSPLHALQFALPVALISASLSFSAYAADTTIDQQLAHWSTQAGQPGDARRGDTFFNSRHGGTWSCASCHGTPPTRPGKHASTGKTLDPLAPAFNPKAFTDSARVDKWFRRNCKDVVSRECSAAEKADVLAYLQGLR